MKENCMLHFTNVQIVERLKRFKWRRSISKLFQNNLVLN